MTNEDKILANTEEILRIIKEQFNITDTTEDTTQETITEFKQQLQELLTTGESSYTTIKNTLKDQLVEQELYSEEDMLIDIFSDNKTQDTILQVKIRPFSKWGKTIDYIYELLGEPNTIETSKYNMRIIIEYKLYQNKQIEEPSEPTDSAMELVNDLDVV